MSMIEKKEILKKPAVIIFYCGKNKNLSPDKNTILTSKQPSALLDKLMTYFNI